MKKVGDHCGAKEKSRGANINVKYCWTKVICCMGQSSELEREIKQKSGGAWPPIRIATASRANCQHLLFDVFGNVCLYARGGQTTACWPHPAHRPV